MVSSVLIDNWTLQNAGELLQHRLTGASTTELNFSPDGLSFQYKPISRDLIAVDCLCQLLDHIVLADELHVDEDFIQNWTEFGQLDVLLKSGVVRAMPFKYLEGQWRARREAIEDLLCFCPEVRERHLDNKAAYAATQQNSDAMLAQVLWGGAGMLARADFFRTSYEPHPLRQRLFMSAGVVTPPAALDQLSRFLDEEALKLYQRSDRTGFVAQFRLPPTIVQVLDRAASLSKLIPAAIELRESYSDLRQWLRVLQTALNKGDAREVIAKQKPLLSVAKYLARFSAGDSAGDVSVQLGVSWLPKVTMKPGAVINRMHVHFGVRAHIRRLALTPQGRGSFRRLLRLLGEEHTSRGAALENDFVRRQSCLLSPRSS